jgi:ATP/maltotriose-dependent transcriptional regulator MalT
MHSDLPAGAGAAPATLTGLRQTKLLRPRLAPDAIARQRLLSVLDRGLEHALILVSGPAGFGKTTLLNQWLGAHPGTVAWLNLDRHESVGTFVLHLIAALAALPFDAGSRAVGLLSAPAAVQPADLGGALADELVALQDESFLVLDDYDAVEDLGVHEVLGGLLAQPPPCLHIVIAARADPPLPLHRLRARGQLLEIRAGDLRFTTEEGVRFLTGSLDGPGDAGDLNRVAESTEGWAAGLRLATIVMRGQVPLAGVAAVFAQRRQAMAMDYLLKEVLERQPPELRDMLLRTAVVERLCAPLCDALLSPNLNGGSPTPGLADEGVKTGEALIAAVLDANLFITRMDDISVPVSPQPKEELHSGASEEVTWYRYHAMFRAALLHELRLRHGSGVVAALHAAASAWFAERGYIDEGVQQALAAGDVRAAAALVERNIHPLIMGDWLPLDHWLAQLPEALRARRPALVLARAWIAFRRGDFPSVPVFVAQAQALLDDQAEPDDRTNVQVASSDRRVLKGEIAALTAIDRFFHDDAPGCLAAADEALSLLPLGHEFARGAAGCFAAIAALAVDGPDGPADWLRRVQDTPPSAPWSALPGVGWAFILGGHYAQAELAGRLLLRRSDGAGLPHAWGHALVGLVKYERNALDEAVDHLHQAFAHSAQTGFLLYRECTFGLALTLQAQGRFDEAAAVVERLETPLLKAANAEQLTVVDAFRVRLTLVRGDVELGQGFLRADGPMTPHWKWLSTLVEAPPMTRMWSRLSLSDSTPCGSRDAAALADELLEVVNESARLHIIKRQVEALVLRSVALEVADQERDALESLGLAIDLAEPGQMVRTFADVGAPLARLLARLAARRPLSAYLEQLVAACAPAESRASPGHDVRSGSLAQQPPRPWQALDALTDRELEVLHGLARRMTNKEIGAELNISELTVKRHAANLYGKLGATSRRQAVRRAVALGVISSN